jgi:hypothetical protein
MISDTYKIGDHVRYKFPLGRPIYKESEIRTGVLVDYDEIFHPEFHPGGTRQVGIHTGSFLAQRSDITEFSLNAVHPDTIIEVLEPVEDKKRYPLITDTVR